MPNNHGAVAPVIGRFRPESTSHFKEVASNIAFLLERPLQKCQEDLSRIYGYSGLHELQETLKKPGVAGPFAGRYDYPESDGSASADFEAQERRIFFTLFGQYKSYWREDKLADDRCFLVFEMGLFQEAAEHRACFEKIKHVLTYGRAIGAWPLIHGWPLGLKSWLASRYTEPVGLVEGWQKLLPAGRHAPIECADIGWQRRSAGFVRLETMFKILAPRISGPKPKGMGMIPFNGFEHNGAGLMFPGWEAYYLTKWLEEKLLSREENRTAKQKELLQAFVQRPSRATAAACEFLDMVEDPVGFRDRWAFECFNAALTGYCDGSKAVFETSQDNGAIRSLFLNMDAGSAEISEGYECLMWQLHYTQTEVVNATKSEDKSALQPVIHANGSLIIPFNDQLAAMTSDEWHFSHDASEFASESAAIAFEEVYLPSIEKKRSDLDFKEPYSIIEIDELLLAASVTPEALESYFAGLPALFDEHCIPDSLGYWSRTLSFDSDDEEENSHRNTKGEFADYIYVPLVILINVDGCGLTFVQATHKNGKRISGLKNLTGIVQDSKAAGVAAMIIDAVKGLSVDVVVYDGDA